MKQKRGIGRKYSSKYLFEKIFLLTLQPKSVKSDNDFPFASVQDTCAALDVGVQGVESGSSIPTMKNFRRSERVHATQRWRGFLFHVFFIMGFARTLLFDSVD